MHTCLVFARIIWVGVYTWICRQTYFSFLVLLVLVLPVPVLVSLQRRYNMEFINHLNPCAGVFGFWSRHFHLGVFILWYTTAFSFIRFCFPHWPFFPSASHVFFPKRFSLPFLYVWLRKVWETLVIRSYERASFSSLIITLISFTVSFFLVYFHPLVLLFHSQLLGGERGGWKGCMVYIIACCVKLFLFLFFPLSSFSGCFSWSTW